MSIYITGDIHGEPKNRFAEPFANLTSKDVVIVCGDFGLPWWSRKMGKSWKDKKQLDWLEAQPYTVVFCDGNHENFKLLNSRPVKEWNGGKVHEIRHNVMHLMRGEIFNISGVKILAFGGAHSTDREYRVLNLSWWKEEIYSADDEKNLERNLQEVDYNVDIVITHAAPKTFLKQKEKELNIDWEYYNDKVSELLTDIESKLKYKMWYFGHYHKDWIEPDQKWRGIYMNIDKI